MINRISGITFILLALFSLGVRSYYLVQPADQFKVTTWDALGYYWYLPGTFIYNDISKLNWFDEVEKSYNLSGGDRYQYRDLENGNRVGKYFLGVSVMESPFFFIGHAYAKSSGNYATDGFSAPYQYSLAFGIVIYFILALFLLRKILLLYYDDITVAISLLILVLGTNLIQYTAVDGSLSHSFIFLLYVLLIHFTIRWHEKPSGLYAALIGFTVGFAILCRPTEAIMIFIPILWGIADKETRKAKWQTVMKHKSHLLWAAAFGALAILPQLIYWKTVTGSFVYNIGSKWQFLNPWFRVLFGFQKGWFIYTPLTLLFIVGFFFMKKYPFKRAILWFSLLNIWIVISWHEWRYGGSYSTRALVQSYPVFALPLGAAVSKIMGTLWKYPVGVVVTYLIFVNLFQVAQYNSGVLLNDGMNRKYYAAIYLNSTPTPLQFSLLDTDEMLDEDGYKSSEILVLKSSKIQSRFDSTRFFISEYFEPSENEDNWLKVNGTIISNTGISDSFLSCDYISEDSSKITDIRLYRPLIAPDGPNQYLFYYDIPDNLGKGVLRCYLKANSFFKGEIVELVITRFSK